MIKELVIGLLLCTSICFGDNAKSVEGIKSSNSLISFTENKGQVSDQNHKTRPDVLFCGTDGKINFHIRNNGVSYQLKRIDSWKTHKNSEVLSKEITDSKLPEKITLYRIDSYWKNCNTNLKIKTDKVSPGYTNYYLPTCPNGALNVQSYEGVSLENLYNGIDVHYYQKDGILKHDYLVAPNVNYKLIQIEIKGADIRIQADGSVVLKTPLGEIQEGAPIVFQNNKQIKASWKFHNNILSFDIPEYDNNQSLIIDPMVRVWGSYYGGNSTDFGQSCATDPSGNVFQSGYTSSTSGTSIATSGAYQTSWMGIEDAYVVKFNSAGIRQWATYYGTVVDDHAYGCAVDNSGNVYISGDTQSPTNIATVTSHQSTFGGGITDAFLAQFNSTGALQWATYYGGSADDIGQLCSTDPSGDIYLIGNTYSTNNISSVGSHQINIGGTQDAFLVKFNSLGVRQWGTYYGGSGDEFSYRVCTDAGNNAYISGYTASTNSISTIGSHQPIHGGGVYDAFLVKFNSSGIQQWGTYYGGGGLDYGQGCTSDNLGNIYLAGYTQSNNNISTPLSHQVVFGGGSLDAFLIKFNSSGTRQWGTYYGGTGNDRVFAITTSTNSNVYLSGMTTSTVGTDIATTDAHQIAYGGGASDAYFAEFNTTGARIYGTYYGELFEEIGFGCTVDNSGKLYLSGYTSSSVNIATSSSHQPVFAGVVDGYLVQFQPCNLPPAPTNITPSVNHTICLAETTTLSVSGIGNINWYPSATSTVSLASGTIYITPTLTVAGTYSYYVQDSTCANGPRTLISVVVSVCTNVLTMGPSTSGVLLYPNPNPGAFTIELNNSFPKTIEVTDVFGRVLRTEKTSDSKINFEIPELSNGIYFLKIDCNEKLQVIAISKQ
jgi:hypothetical protein